MAADTEAKPDLWNTDQVRHMVDAALQNSMDDCARCKACDSQVDAVMEVIRDLMATIAAAEHERASERQQMILRLQAKLAETRRQLAVRQGVDRNDYDELNRLMVARATVRVADSNGRNYQKWTATIAGMADHPTVVLDCSDGKRRVLPQTFTYTEVPQ